MGRLPIHGLRFNMHTPCGRAHVVDSPPVKGWHCFQGPNSRANEPIISQSKYMGKGGEDRGLCWYGGCPGHTKVGDKQNSSISNLICSPAGAFPHGKLLWRHAGLKITVAVLLLQSRVTKNRNDQYQCACYGKTYEPPLNWRGYNTSIHHITCMSFLAHISHNFSRIHRLIFLKMLFITIHSKICYMASSKHFFPLKVVYFVW